MNISINNKEVNTSASTLSELAEEMALPQNGVAIAINNKMIPKTEWVNTELTEGINVIIIKAACGG